VQEAAKIPIANTNQTEQEREKGRGEGRNCVRSIDSKGVFFRAYCNICFLNPVDKVLLFSLNFNMI
jgi:hypothetical protein